MSDWAERWLERLKAGDVVGCWLQQHYGKTHFGFERLAEGTYGCVWIFKALQPNVIPSGFAAKTFRVPEANTSPIDVKKLFEREIGLWVRIPPHFNVVMALGVDFVPIPAEAKKNFDGFPVVRMPLFDGTVRTWISSPPSIDEPGTLSAIAQLCNGLQWLYSHGVSGHGDLKPENILFQDLSGRFDLGVSGFPSRQTPWRISVADLGWADAWRHMGLSDRCWRPYLAPERQERVLDGAKTDVFSIGVIFTELLTGLHPAGKPTSQIARWNRGGWLNWAQTGRRELDAVKDDSLRSIINECLQPDPNDRPDPLTILASVSEHAEKNYGIPLASWLDALNKDAEDKEYLHAGWASEEIARAGAELRNEAVDDLRERLQRTSLSGSSEDKIAAVWLARSLANLLSISDEPREWQEAIDLLLHVGRLILNEIDAHDWKRAIIYAPEGMSSRDSAVEALYDLLAALRHIAGDELPEVVGFRRRILAFGR
jgi:serine/threonine protein kinase